MQVVLLRVGIDTGSGGMHSPLFADGTFEFVPIPDSRGYDKRTYGNFTGKAGRKYIEYFLEKRQRKMHGHAMHVDPEFQTFTYGDPTPPKRGLSQLQRDDLLVFYAGMEGWQHDAPPALYLAGMFRVKLAGFANQFTSQQLRTEFGQNFHVRHPAVFAADREKLLLIKGGTGSRLFRQACQIGERVKRKNGTYWQFITSEMAKIFGRFGGTGSMQRSTPCWVEEKRVPEVIAFLEKLP